MPSDSKPPFTLDRLRADVAGMISAGAPPGDEDNLLDLGLDSMRAMSLAMAWDEAGVPLDFADIAEAPTIAALWALAQERQGRPA